MPEDPERIIIAGCGAVTALGIGVSALRTGLRNNTSGLRASARFDSPRFQSRMVGEVERKDGWIEEEDPAYSLGSRALQEACFEATELIASLDPKRIGLVLSTTKANIEALERVCAGRPCSDRARRHLEGDLMAADLAAEHGVRGPVECVSVACVSGLIALQQGARLIRRGAADAVMVVGVDHLSEFVMAGFTALKALDPLGCRPFDRDRCGLSPGEAGAAIVLVKSQELPAGRVAIRGWGSTNDANHMTGPSRDGSGMAAAIEAALRMARLDGTSIGLVNAHGTGTPYNDTMECLALAKIFGTACPPVNGSKGMLGHTLGAAGVVETILCVLAMQEGCLPGTPGLGTPANDAPASLLKAPIPGHRINHVLKLNSGFGGVNGALILSHG